MLSGDGYHCRRPPSRPVNIKHEAFQRTFPLIAFAPMTASLTREAARRNSLPLRLTVSREERQRVERQKKTPAPATGSLRRGPGQAGRSWPGRLEDWLGLAEAQKSHQAAAEEQQRAGEGHR